MRYEWYMGAIPWIVSFKVSGSNFLKADNSTSKVKIAKISLHFNLKVRRNRRRAYVFAQFCKLSSMYVKASSLSDQEQPR